MESREAASDALFAASGIIPSAANRQLEPHNGAAAAAWPLSLLVVPWLEPVEPSVLEQLAAAFASASASAFAFAFAFASAFASASAAASAAAAVDSTQLLLTRRRPLLEPC
jgi:hypothetical protein